MVTVVPDVGANPAALAPPLVAVSSQTGGTNTPFKAMFPPCAGLFVSRCSFVLPGLDVLRHDAPRQVIVAVIAPRVVEEIRPGREDVAWKAGATLGDQHTR